ncbi:hypothetical protein B0H34DRAFT_801845 [Crassisporium funariophilum]|nr:hypothetical protein B0H34DRAFT_801845 [Crassisporium funariophilum]
MSDSEKPSTLNSLFAWSLNFTTRYRHLTFATIGPEYFCKILQYHSRSGCLARITSSKTLKLGFTGATILLGLFSTKAI